MSSKLKYIALIGFTGGGIYLVTVGIGFGVWKRLSQGQERIMWHHRLLEGIFLISTLLICLIGGILMGVLEPKEASIFPYAIEYPPNLLYS